MSGRWPCANNELLSVEDIFDVINKYGVKGVKVIVLNDCPGAMGIYHRYLWLLESKRRVYDNIGHTTFETSCEYNEVSFANHSGGIFSINHFKNEGSESVLTYNDF